MKNRGPWEHVYDDGEYSDYEQYHDDNGKNIGGRVRITLQNINHQQTAYMVVTFDNEDGDEVFVGPEIDIPREIAEKILGLAKATGAV